MTYRNVKDLQRKLLLTTGGVLVVVGISGWKFWNDMKSVMASASAMVKGDDDDDDDNNVNKHRNAEVGAVVMKRVLVRRRLDDPPDAPGEVVESHLLGTINQDTLGDTHVKPPKEETSSVSSIAASLPMNTKVIIFGSMVAAFVVFNVFGFKALRKNPAWSARAAAPPLEKKD